MSLSDLKTWVEIVQGIVTALGVIVAGIWSFYVFVLGRGFAPNIQIQFELKQVVDLLDGKGAIVLVKIKNIGRTRIRKDACFIATALVPKDQRDLPELGRIDVPLKFSEAKVYPVFDTHTSFEPNEEATEDVLFALGKSPTFKVGVIFVDHRKKAWSSNAILDTRMVKRRSEKSDQRQ